MKLPESGHWGIKMGNITFSRCKQRRMNPNDPTPAPPLKGEGSGGVIIFNRKSSIVILH
jgi:hypothetical protein